MSTQKLQRCWVCGEPTGRCEDDSIYLPMTDGSDLGPLCEACFDERRSNAALPRDDVAQEQNMKEEWSVSAALAWADSRLADHNITDNTLALAALAKEVRLLRCAPMVADLEIATCAGICQGTAVKFYWSRKREAGDGAYECYRRIMDRLRTSTKPEGGRS